MPCTVCTEGLPLNVRKYDAASVWAYYNIIFLKAVIITAMHLKIHCSDSQSQYVEKDVSVIK